MTKAVRVMIVVQQVVADPPRGNRVAQRRGQPAGRRYTATRHLVDQPSQREDQIGDGRKGLGIDLIATDLTTPLPSASISMTEVS